MSEHMPVRKEFPVETTFGGGAIPPAFKAFEGTLEEDIKELERMRETNPNAGRPTRPPRRVPLE